MTDERERLARAEKMLSDYQEQLGKPFQHETRLMELLVKQDELNRALDLDKGERQVAPEKAASPTLLKNCLHPCGLRRSRQARRRAGGAYTKGRRCGPGCDAVRIVW